MTSKKPAPYNSFNAARNGTRVVRLTVGELPKQLLSARDEGRSYRRGLEQAMIDAGREVDVVAAHAIDTATAATLHAAICRWLLKNRFEKMDEKDILACSQQMVKAKQARDRAFARLRLDQQEMDTVELLYHDDEPRDSHETARDGQGGVQSTQEPSPQRDGKCEVCEGEDFLGKICPRCNGKEVTSDR